MHVQQADELIDNFSDLSPFNIYTKGCGCK